MCKSCSLSLCFTPKQRAKLSKFIFHVAENLFVCNWNSGNRDFCREMIRFWIGHGLLRDPIVLNVINKLKCNVTGNQSQLPSKGFNGGIIRGVGAFRTAIWSSKIQWSACSEMVLRADVLQNTSHLHGQDLGSLLDKLKALMLLRKDNLSECSCAI